MTRIMESDLSPDIIKSLAAGVFGYLGQTYGKCLGLETYLNSIDLADAGDPIGAEVFLLERGKEFKYGPGKELIAIVDGGKNKFGKPIKCVRYFNYYTGSAKAQANDRTYTYSHDKAAEMWKTKIAEGFKRVQ